MARLRISRLIIRGMLFTTASLVLLSCIALLIGFCFPPHYTTETFLEFSAGGRQLVVGAHNGDAQLWDLTQSPPVGHLLSLRSAGPVYGRSVRFIDDDTLLAIRASPSDENAVEIVWWDVHADREIRTLSIPGEGYYSTSRQVSGNGRWLIDVWKSDSGGPAQSQIHIWDLEERAIVKTLQIPMAVHLAIVSDDGKWVACNSRDTKNTFDLWSCASGEKVREIDLPGFSSFAFPRRGSTFAITEFDSFRLVDPASNEEKVFTNAPADAVIPIAFSQDQNRVMSFGEAGVLVWDALKQQVIAQPATTLHQANLSPDGKWVALYRMSQARLYDCDSSTFTDLPSLGASYLPSVCTAIFMLVVSLPILIITLALERTYAKTPHRPTHSATIVTAEVVDDEGTM